MSTEEDPRQREILHTIEQRGQTLRPGQHHAKPVPSQSSGAQLSARRTEPGDGGSVDEEE